MDRRQAAAACVALAAMAAIAWVVSFGGSVRLRTQLDAAASSGDDGPVSFGDGLRTGVAPQKWKPHVPANAHMGRHRMYRHPSSCSPLTTAPQQLAWDWRFAPPSEGDL